MCLCASPTAELKGMSEAEAERADLPYCVVKKGIWAANGNKTEEEGDKRKEVMSDLHPHMIISDNSTTRPTPCQSDVFMKKTTLYKYKSPVGGG